MICRITGCENEATRTVRIQLPKRPDPLTEIAEEARQHDIEICQDHLDQMSTGTGEYSFKPSDDSDGGDA